MTKIKETLTATALSLALIASAGAAAADRISLLLGSRHIGAPGMFKESNPGLFYTWEQPRVNWSIGAFRNSYGRASVAALAAVPLARWDNGELSAFAGIAHYPGDGRRQPLHLGDVIPIGGLQLRQGNVFLQVTPMDGNPVKALVAVGLTFEVGK